MNKEKVQKMFDKHNKEIIEAEIKIKKGKIEKLEAEIELLKIQL